MECVFNTPSGLSENLAKCGVYAIAYKTTKFKKNIDVTIR